MDFFADYVWLCGFFADYMWMRGFFCGLCMAVWIFADYVWIFGGIICRCVDLYANYVWICGFMCECVHLLLERILLYLFA